MPNLAVSPTGSFKTSPPNGLKIKIYIARKKPYLQENEKNKMTWLLWQKPFNTLPIPCRHIPG